MNRHVQTRSSQFRDDCIVAEYDPVIEHPWIRTEWRYGKRRYSRNECAEAWGFYRERRGFTPA